MFGSGGPRAFQVAARVSFRPDLRKRPARTQPLDLSTVYFSALTDHSTLRYAKAITTVGRVAPMTVLAA